MQTADWQLLFSDRFTGARNPARLPTKDAIPSNPLRPPFQLPFYYELPAGSSVMATDPGDQSRFPQNQTTCDMLIR